MHAHVHAPGHTHAQKYVILIAFSRQQWLHEGASLLRYTFTVCLLVTPDPRNKYLLVPQTVLLESSLELAGAVFSVTYELNFNYQYKTRSSVSSVN